MGLGHRGGSSAPLGKPLVIAIGIGCTLISTSRLQHKFCKID